MGLENWLQAVWRVFEGRGGKEQRQGNGKKSACAPGTDCDWRIKAKEKC